MSKKFYLISLSFYFCALFMSAQNSLRLSPIFASGMVLQQNEDVIFWGWGEPNEKVEIYYSWDNKMLESKVNERGRWEVTVKTPSGGHTPYTVSVRSAEDSILLSDVLIGDVWFVGGQSNMQMNFHGNPDQPVFDAQRMLLRCKHKGIRLFRVNNGYAISASDTLTIDGKWTLASPDNVKEFSVVGYIFGEKLHELTDIPIGLVQSAHGGSTAEAWLDYETLKRFGGFDLNLEQKKIDPIWYAFEPTVLYNKMLAPMLPLSVKGVIWYQGESNVDRPEQYRRLFPELVRTWRKYFADDGLPFYYVQIAPYNHQNVNSAVFREVQLDCMRTIPNVGMAVALDVGEADIIHPARKEVIGERLAYWALNNVYGYSAFGCRGPEFRSMEVHDGHAFLKFDFAPNGLSFMGKQPTGFEIAGEDKVFYPAQVRITPAFWGNEGLEVWSCEVVKPVAVRYGFSNYVDGSLYNTEGLPASSFRTDNW